MRALIWTGVLFLAGAADGFLLETVLDEALVFVVGFGLGFGAAFTAGFAAAGGVGLSASGETSRTTATALRTSSFGVSTTGGGAFTTGGVVVAGGLTSAGGGGVSAMTGFAGITAGIRPGDQVASRYVPGVGIVIERRQDDAQAAFRRQLEDIAHRRPLQDGPLAGMATDDIMRLLRGEE